MMPQEYINNTNPFASMRSYMENSAMDADKKTKLGAIHQLQPKFISLGIDQPILRREFVEKSELAISRGIAELLRKGMSLVQDTSGEDPESVLRRSTAIPEVVDILIDINRLRLLHKQRKLREKVFQALKSIISAERMNAIDLSSEVPEDYLRSAIEYEAFESKYSAKRETQ
jgi:hypothetical protein